jgi:hypothetical protein
MKTTSSRTPVRELIESLNVAISASAKTEQVEKMIYDMLEFEKHIIADAYDTAITNITKGVSMDGYQYYETKFDNQ